MYLSSHCESPAVAHNRPSKNVSGVNAKERIGLESWADPSKARTRTANAHFSPLSNVWNKIQMNQLFQGQSFNYTPASRSADKNANSLLTPVPTATLLSSVLRRGPRPLCPGDYYYIASPSQPPGLSLCKEPRSQAEGPSLFKSLGSSGWELKSQLHAFAM